MIAEELEIPGVYLFKPKKFGDERGFFSETFNAQTLGDYLGPLNFVQDNHAYSKDKGVMRGLHFQAPPFDQGKLVRVTRGSVLDVIVDIRTGSPTYGQHLSVELSAENWAQLWVPPGFAHAYCTLEDHTEFVYKVTNFYSPDHDGGIAYDDHELGIEWPMPFDQMTVSDKDKKHPKLSELISPFTYEV
ncbi:dTDP-4-dehydrorhamnose 3,5-epimerase [Temperatibacter marinus]|uniref:dTDP-4-dehydrorhamnose 3,5-epimerase n=1 Tax=Temperatibacter marinus TaxID=1456591 RepID=A0AA52H9S4_9PROT|nr:dTDP-4-dehydrorhamnose 3,5-epimerase [Temperatibacter marinus]WND03219.1 dTDP-4-dehydrorhamnose 3,5-epimerase [Temperatibacter marinus]